MEDRDQGNEVPVQSGQRSAAEEVNYRKGEDNYGHGQFHVLQMQAETLRHQRAMNDIAEARARQDLFTDQQARIGCIRAQSVLGLEYVGTSPDANASKIVDSGSAVNTVGLQHVATKLAEALLPVIVAATGTGADAAEAGSAGS